MCKYRRKTYFPYNLWKYSRDEEKRIEKNLIKNIFIFGPSCLNAHQTIAPERLKLIRSGPYHKHISAPQKMKSHKSQTNPETRKYENKIVLLLIFLKLDQQSEMFPETL